MKTIKWTKDIHNKSIGYYSTATSHADRLTKALNSGYLLIGYNFGTIHTGGGPSLYIGYLYTYDNKMYGSFILISTNSDASGFYSCSNSIFTKQ